MLERLTRRKGPQEYRHEDIKTLIFKGELNPNVKIIIVFCQILNKLYKRYIHSGQIKMSCKVDFGGFNPPLHPCVLSVSVLQVVSKQRCVLWNDSSVHLGERKG